MQRPSAVLLESAYHELFHSTLDKLRDSAAYGRLFHSGYDEEGVPGRSIAWKLFLIRQPPSLKPYPEPPLDPLRHTRQRYASLLEEKMRAPDGSYEEGFPAPTKTSRDTFPISRSSNAPKKPDNWTLNNPLSLDSSNPWHAYFSALELRKTIRQDVERTFPEVPYFRSPAVQNEMTHILFLHVTERENIGYRQGMHEILACVYRAVDFDSIEKGRGKVRPDLEELCDRTYVAADAFTLFGTIMERMETWYEWRPPIADSVSPISPVSHVPHFSANGEIISSKALNPQIDILENGQLGLKPYVAPIIPTCVALRDEKLKAVDPHLWEKLRDGGVETQMYGMRWLRLLFTREFSMPESMLLWDALFASISTDPISPSSSSSSKEGFELALWISVAMLIRIRNNLIPGDYTTQLTHLLRYPLPCTLGTSSSDTSNAPALLLSQAQLLMMSPRPSSGVSLVMQNRNELGIPVEVPDPPSPPLSRRRANATAPPTISVPQSRASHTSDRPRLQDMIASRLMDANESLGIQRGFFNTITELRKNLPDLSQTLTRTPAGSSSSISLGDERGDTSVKVRRPSAPTPEFTERPPWEPKPRSEIEREIADLRGLLKTLGNAVGWAVDVLLLDEEVQNPKEGEKSLRQKKMEAVECMAYVRDVLARGGTGEIDEERLVSEEEYQRQRRMKQERATAAAAANTPPSPPKPVLPPPRVASSTDSLDTITKSRPVMPTRESTRPISPLTKTTPFQASPPSNAPLTTFSTRTTRIPPTGPVSSPSTSQSGPKMFAPPWKHTPSNFSGDAPYTSSVLPRLPPPSTTAPSRSDWRQSDYSQPQSSSQNAPDPLKADPLGALH